MRIGIDIDDTLTDTFEVLIKDLCQYRNIDESYIYENNMYYGELFDDPSINFWEYSHDRFDTVIPTVKVKKDAKEVLDELHKKGHYIEFITARRDYEYSHPYELTYKYLTDNNIYFDKLTIRITDKVSYCKENNIDIFIDDSMDHVTSVKEKGIEAILFTNIYNKNSNIEPRVNTWKELLEYINNKEV